MTVHGILHLIFGAFVFSLAPVTCFVFWRRFCSDERWRSLRTWTLVAGIVITTAVVLLRIGAPRPPAPGNALTSWIGVIQRAALVAFLAWVFTFARALYQRAGGFVSVHGTDQQRRRKDHAKTQRMKSASRGDALVLSDGLAPPSAYPSLSSPCSAPKGTPRATSA